uniref:C-type lectin domain-containing protein n=1 Tax=Plectus sambesii TaxID=2011161 RepID=A0A914VU25_9BILA
MKSNYKSPRLGFRVHYRDFHVAAYHLFEPFVLENGIEFNPGIGFVWIGLSNLHSSVLTDYKWNDGSALTYTHWFVGDQIHQAHPEVDSCVGFFVSDLPNFSAYAATWTAGPTGACNQTWPFVCQVSPV